MTTTRRETIGVLAGLGAGLGALALAEDATQAQMPERADPQGTYGLVIHYKAKPGKRDELMAVMKAGLPAMAGSSLFLIGADTEEADSVWVTELWVDKATHDRALQSPAGQAEVAKGNGLVDRVVSRAVIRPA
jgi:quinol monooxygenase YgiN